MLNIIKSFFKKQKYYIKAQKTGSTEIDFLMDFTDIVKVMNTVSEVEVVRLKGDYTFYIGRR